MSKSGSDGTILNQVLALVIASVGVRPDEVTLATDLTDLGADSVDMVEALFAVEEKFKIEIDVRSFDELRTVGDFVRLVERHLHPEAPGRNGPAFSGEPS